MVDDGHQHWADSKIHPSNSVQDKFVYGVNYKSRQQL